MWDQCWEIARLGARLPGQLFHNIISHGIAKLAEFLDDDLTDIVATAHQSEQLQGLGVQGVLDELRVMIQDKVGTTAFFCFSTQIKALNQLRVYGPVNSMTADIITGSLVRNEGRAYKSYLTYFIPPLKSAREQLKNARMNILNFLRRRLYLDFGMKELIERFYESVRTGGPPPIPYREIDPYRPYHGRNLRSDLSEFRGDDSPESSVFCHLTSDLRHRSSVLCPLKAQPLLRSRYGSSDL